METFLLALKHIIDAASAVKAVVKAQAFYKDTERQLQAKTCISL